MATKRDENVGGFVPFDLESLEPDAAMLALVSRGQAMQAERRLPPKDRQRKARQRQKDEARAGKRALYDLPEEVIQRIASMARWNQTTASGVAALALTRFLEDVDAGRVKLSDYLEPIDSPRYTYRVNLEKQDKW